MLVPLFEPEVRNSPRGSMCANFGFGALPALHAQLMDAFVKCAVGRRTHFGRFGRGNFEEIRQVVQFDLAAHPAKLLGQSRSVMGNLCSVFHGSLQAHSGIKMKGNQERGCEVAYTANGFLCRTDANLAGTRS